MDQLLKTLIKQNQILAEIRDLLHQDKKALTLGPTNLPIKIFVGKEGDRHWYTRPDHSNIPFEAESLKGFITGINRFSLTSEEFNTESEKVDLYLEGDRTYIIRKGLDTVWSRKILLSIPFLDLAQPVQIWPEPGDKGNTIFCNLQQPGLENVEWDKDISIDALWLAAWFCLCKTKNEMITEKEKYPSEYAQQAWNYLPEKAKQKIKALT